MKKLFTYFTAVLFVFVLFTAPAMSCDDCVPTTNADVEAGVGIYGTITINPDGSDLIGGTYLQDPASNDTAGNFGTADVTLDADAFATAKDTYKRVWVRTGRCFWNGRYENVLVPGEAEAYGRNVLTLSSDVDVCTNGPQDDGLSYTGVKATTKLDIDGVAWAEGTNGCPQKASIDVNGSISAYAYGNSFSGDKFGAFASAGGSGLTTVDFEGHEYDFSEHGGWFCSPNKAEVDFHSTITVDQGLFTASYVNEAGTIAANFAFVGGGNAELNLGRDGWFGRDDIELTGIQATGKVGQSGFAFDGGAYAMGNSQAFFNGAYGSVETTSGGCFSASPDQTANVGGYAVVTGYNNVSVQSNLITVTSVQHANATTGNSGHVSTPNQD